ncbi:MAG: class I SAM-dependent methyltransferase [Candidatus Promineofilum sp.]|nr:class I SAM-dependent methyltransferase [Promineifilum sp.]MCW5862841.1 class I SAM-dependent methyltransferase [Anaerolineae bacterium]
MITVPCNLCGRDDYRVRFPATTEPDALRVDAFRCTHAGYGHHPQIVECRHCGLVYANPRWPTDTVLEAYTSVEDETYVEERHGRELTFRHHLRRIERIVGPAAGRALLDVGAYIGVFVEVAAAAGWRAQGVEPSSWAAAEAQRRGLAVHTGTLDSVDLPPESFDLITMWDVIEHLSDPAAELARARRLLRPGGWLVAHTMDISAPLARIMGPRWPWLMDMHIYYFDRRTLPAMFTANGLRVVWQGTQGRYLRLGYLATRVGGLNAGLGRLAGAVVDGLGLHEAAVPVNFGDLITCIGQRPF